MSLPVDFPADAHGDALRRLLAGGDDLTRSRPVEFAHLFEQASDAQAFCQRVRAVGFSVPDASSTEVIVSVPLVPTYAAITATEAQLGAFAAESGGRSDGWGCFSLGPTTHPST